MRNNKLMITEEKFLEEIKILNKRDIEVLYNNIICFLYNISIECSPWSNSFDIIAIQFSSYSVFSLNELQIIRKKRGLDDIINFKDYKNMSDYFYSEKVDLSLSLENKDFPLINWKPISFLFDFLKIEEVEGTIESKMLSSKKPSLDFYFNLILCYGLHKNTMSNYRKSNQLLLVLPVFFIKYKFLDYDEERLFFLRMSDKLNIRVVKNKREEGVYDLIIGEFNTFLIFNNFDFIHFNEIILSKTNNNFLNFLFEILEITFEKSFFLGELTFRFSIPKNKSDVKYEIIDGWLGKQSLPVCIVDPINFPSRLLSLRE